MGGHADPAASGSVGWPPVDPNDVAAALSVALKHGGEWAEVYAERRTTATIRLTGGAVADLRTDLDLGAGVRVVSGGRSGYAYTNILTRRCLIDAGEAAAIASGARPPSVQPTSVDLQQRPIVPVQQAARPAADVETRDKVDLLRRVDSAAHAVSAHVRDVTATHVDVTQTVLIAASEGVVVGDQRVRTRLTCQVTARRDGRLQTGFDGPGIGGGMELYTADEPEAVGRRAAQRALHALDGVDPPNGPLPVVLGPSGGGLLLHEACGHGLEAEGLARSSSIYAATIGQRVASPLLTAVDDPSLAGGFGSYAVDDEAITAARTVLLDQGQQTGALTDRENAGLLSVERSANGRRQSYAHPPLARMSNTFILPGSSHADDVVNSVRNGVYVARLRGGDVDVTTGEFAFSASESFLIEDGHITRPLLSLTLLGNGPLALASVEAVCDDLAFTQALCGKEDQWIPVSYGSPTLLISGLTISAGDHG